MSALSIDSLAAYWSMPIVEANIVVFFNLLGALLLGLLVGYGCIETLYTPAKNLAVLSRIDFQEPRLVLTLGLHGHSRFIAKNGKEIVFTEDYSTITTFNSSLGERQYLADKTKRFVASP